MKHKVEYLTDKKPKISVAIMKIASGVWMINCNFEERLSFDGCGGGENGDGTIEYESIYFGEEDRILIEMKFFPPEGGHLFGDMSKREFHGFFMTRKKYEKLWKEWEVKENGK